MPCSSFLLYRTSGVYSLSVRPLGLHPNVSTTATMTGYFLVQQDRTPAARCRSPPGQGSVTRGHGEVCALPLGCSTRCRSSLARQASERATRFLSNKAREGERDFIPGTKHRDIMSRGDMPMCQNNDAALVAISSHAIPPFPPLPTQ